MRKIIVALLLIMPLLTFAQGDAKKKAYYFYGEQCPHCQKVDEYFKANGIYDKYDITKLEFSNPFNARLLMKFGDVFNSQYKGSVPAVAFGDKFLVGDQPIIDGFEKDIAAVDATELPDPDKISAASGNKALVDAEALAGKSAGKGNKKNLFPVLMGVLILVVGGGLVYINLKKNKG